MQQRAIPFVIISAPVEIINLTVFEQGDGPFANLIRGAVVQAQLVAATTHINTATAQHHAIGIDALMRVPDDEEIIFPCCGGTICRSSLKASALISCASSTITA